VVFYEKPLQKFERILVTGLQEFPWGLPQLTRSLTSWLGGRLWMRGDLCARLGCRDDQLLFSEHHLSHAASSFLTSPFKSAAILTVDGVGEWTTTAIHRASSDDTGTRIEALRELHFPHSIGLLYSSLTAFLGFEVNEGEYKVMGLASYGQPRFLDEMKQLCTVNADASMELDLRYFSFHRHPTRSFTPALEGLLGVARLPNAPLQLPPRSEEDQRFADIAASLQRFTEDYLLALAHEAHRLTGERHLCLAGGVALNCVANGRIAREGPFDDVFVHPAAGDSGGAVGAALWASHVLLGVPRRETTPSPFLGAAATSAEVASVVQDLRLPHEQFSDDTTLMAEVARRLSVGEVGGFFRGRFEWGPRALGARSILADARHHGMRDRINRKIKFREGFRPFAPAALEEDVPRFFHAQASDALLRTHMLSVTRVREDAQQQLPSITHVDGTARVQSVSPSSDAPFRPLLEAFKARTGVGVLLNTSMNLKDEPLVSSPTEACALFLQSDLDFLVLEDCLVTRRAA